MTTADFVSHPFQGSVLSSTPCELGEGASFDADTGTIWWFSILEKQLRSLDINTGKESVQILPIMGSVLVPIDAERQLIASDQGLFIRDRATGELTLHCDLEKDKPDNRSNDGRLHPSGALWIGTMGRTAAEGAGAIYHVVGGKVTTLFDKMSIPNAICFSPDGSTGYYVDTRINHLMRVDIDPLTGLPTSKPTLFIDGSGSPGGMDGAICDQDGTIWNARWGEGAVDHYGLDGVLLARFEVPAKRTTCPVVIGNGRLAVTSAWEGMDQDARTSDPLAGALFELAVPVTLGREPRYSA